MRENGNWGQDRGLVCRNCGATNAADAAYCASCGSALGDPEQQLIDVSTGEPHVIVSGQQGVSGTQGWGRERVEMGRVYVARGGRRGCLLLNIIFVLLACCACWVLWNALGSVF